MRPQIGGLAGKPLSPVMLSHHRRLTALCSQALPHCLAGMSADPDPGTFGEASNSDFELPGVHSSPSGTLLSSESGSQPDDDLIHPVERPRKGPTPRAINVWLHVRSSGMDGA
jgi:hypothetical protein